MSSSESGDGEPEIPQPLDGKVLSPQEQLLSALIEDHLEEFEELLKNKEVNLYHKYHRRNTSLDIGCKIGSCLEIACRKRDKGQFVHALLKKIKPNVNSIIPEPIHYAAKVGANDAMAELLRDKRTQVNAVNSRGDTALHYLAEYYKPEDEYKKCLNLLLWHRDIDINKPNRKGYTAIHQAANYKHKEVVQSILKRFKGDLDLDTHSGSGRTARVFLAQTYPDLVPSLPPRKYNTSHGYENQLLVAFHNLHLEVFRGLLRQVDEDGNPLFDPNFRYGRPLNETCLEMACKQEGYQEFLKALLEAGADPNNVNQSNYKAPIHVAAETLNYEALEILLHNPGTNVNAVDKDGWTALHFATAQPSAQSTQSVKCIQLLCQGIKVKDKIDALIELARSYGNTKALELFTNLKPEENAQGDIIDELREYLLNKQVQEFISKYKDGVKNNQELIESLDYCNEWFLYIAIESDLVDIVETLLENKSNPNIYIYGNPALVMAAKQQNIAILKLLLNAPILDVDAADMKGDTALHHAVRAENFDCIIALLSHGASTKKENVLGKAPLPLNRLKSLLDKSLKTNDKYPQHEDYEVIFDYTLLTASNTERVTRNSEPDKKDIHQTVIDVTKISDDELQADQAMEQDQLMNQLHAENTDETVSESSTNCNQDHDSRVEDIISDLKAETELLYYLSNNDQEYRCLLHHPIINSFMHFKWDCVKFFFYMNLIVYVSYFIVLNCYIMYSPHGNENCTNNTESHTFNKSTFINLESSTSYHDFWIPLIVLTVLISLREVFQLFNSNSKSLLYIFCFRVDIIPQYFTDWENYLDLVILGITWYIIFISSENCSRSTWNVYVILLASWELILILGRCPVFSRNIEMLKSVTMTYCWLFLTFLSIILAFAHCLYIVFRKNMQTETIYTAFWALCKTMIFMTGEYNADTLDFKSMPYVSVIVFFLFVFFISIVLLNLLIGLSVNNTKMIEDRSEVVCLTSRIHVIYHTESTVLTFCKIYKKFFPNCKFINMLNESVLLFPKGKQDKIVRILQNRDGEIKGNPYFHSQLRKCIRHICFCLRNGLRYIVCKKLNKCDQIEKSKMEKNILEEAVKIISSSQDSARNEINKRKCIVEKSIMEMLDNLNNISNQSPTTRETR